MLKTAFGRATLFMVLIALVALCTLPACEDKLEDVVVDYEYDYYPLDSGRFIIYDVDSITYGYTAVGNGQFIQDNDTATYQLMELNAGSFYDSLQGYLKYRIEYYRRQDATQPWQNDRVWYIIKTGTNLQRQEDDLRFMKLVFPPRQSYEWDGTSFIPKTGLYEFLDEWRFKYTDVGNSYSINGNDFAKTVTVSHVLIDDNEINYQLSKEVFAKGVGIVYKEWDKIEKQGIGTGWVNPQGAEGFRIRMKVNSYGP